MHMQVYKIAYLLFCTTLYSVPYLYKSNESKRFSFGDIDLNKFVRYLIDTGLRPEGIESTPGRITDRSTRSFVKVKETPIVRGDRELPPP